MAGTSTAAPGTTRQRHHVVVIGSGFGGLFSAKALKRADVDITLVAKTSHHLFQPLLYQVATGILSQGEIAPSTREILSRQKNVAVLLGEVTDIDLEAQTVTSMVLGDKTVTAYDSLIVAAGASQSYFGNDHFAEDAPGMKSIDDALELRGRIFGAFELAELGASRGENVDHLLTFVVVGAGPTGVEMAGQIAELANRTLKRDFHHINTRNARVILLDAAAQVLPPFGQKLGEHTKKDLEKLGVEVVLGAMVTDLDERGIDVAYKDGRTERIVAVTKIWAAGVQGSALGRTLAEQSGAPLDRAGRIGVNPDLTLPGHPEVFVIGDMIALDNLPGVAQVAIQGAKYAAHSIERRIEGKPPQKAFKYFDKGSMATISRFKAVALIGKVRLTGLPGLAGLARPAPDLHHRVQEPDHRAAPLVHLVPRPRPGRTDHHRAAGLRPGRPAAAQGRRRRPRLRARRLRPRAGDHRGQPPGRARGTRAGGGAAHRQRPARRPGGPALG